MKRYLVLLPVLFLVSANMSGNPDKNIMKDGIVARSTEAHQYSYALDPAVSLQKRSVTVNEIVKSYLELKDALAGDNSAEAAKAGATLKADIEIFDKSTLNQEQKGVFEDMATDASENAEHISKSGSNIAHQREHFDLLSQDIYDLVKKTGAGKPIYRIFCQRYNKGKGAYWLSATRDIQNPYLGKAVTNCGTVVEELRP